MVSSIVPKQPMIKKSSQESKARGQQKNGNTKGPAQWYTTIGKMMVQSTMVKPENPSPKSNGQKCTPGGKPPVKKSPGTKRLITCIHSNDKVELEQWNNKWKDISFGAWMTMEDGMQGTMDEMAWTRSGRDVSKWKARTVDPMDNWDKTNKTREK